MHKAYDHKVVSRKAIYQISNICLISCSIDGIAVHRLLRINLATEAHQLSNSGSTFEVLPLGVRDFFFFEARVIISGSVAAAFLEQLKRLN